MVKIIAMWFSLCAYLVLFLGGVPVLITRQLPADALNKTMSLPEILISCMLAIPALVLLVYGAVCVWLLTWRCFSTSAEIMQIAGAGPVTKWDRWLIKTLGPQK